MKIIGGQFRRRILNSPPGAEKTRPMPARVREAVFNLLRGHVEGEAVFDGFAGSGSIGLEALSRGAARVVFVERDREIAEILRSNIALLGVDDRAEVIGGDALGVAAAARCPDPAHLIFFDPPYPLMQDPERRRQVLEQFGQLIQKLDDTGYAVLRTPWPLVDRIESEDEEAPARFEDVDLHIAGALGPETHAYTTMACHLYMRER